MSKMLRFGALMGNAEREGRRVTSDRDRHLDTIFDLALKAIKTRSDAELEAFLADVRFLIGPENYPVMGILKSPVVGFSPETKAKPEGSE